MADALDRLDTAATRIVGSIEASLQRAAGDAGPALAAQVARLLQWRGDLVRHVQPGDALALLFERAAAPELVALRYRGSELALTALRFDDELGLSRFYDEDARAIVPLLRRAPVLSYLQITEVVQAGRGKRRHHGLDLKALEGTPVVLPFAARVARIDWNRRINGNCVEVVYDDPGLPPRTLGRFLHLLYVADGVVPGVRLPPGAPLGAVGSSGRSGGPHLHYELRDAADEVLDPLTLHGTLSAQLPAAELGDFERWRESCFRRLPPLDPRPPK